MSVEGKILSALIANTTCVVKEISSIAGVSQRAAYNCLKKFEAMGIIEKSTDAQDKRFHVVSILPGNLCRTLCDKVPAEINSEVN